MEFIKYSCQVNNFRNAKGTSWFDFPYRFKGELVNKTNLMNVVSSLHELASLVTKSHTLSNTNSQRKRDLLQCSKRRKEQQVLITILRIRNNVEEVAPTKQTKVVQKISEQRKSNFAKEDKVRYHRGKLTSRSQYAQEQIGGQLLLKICKTQSKRRKEKWI